jgi:hypothetical protein
MKEEPFKAFLKARGKKIHVVERLIGHVRRFEEYLKRESSRSLDEATSRELQAYLAFLESSGSGVPKSHCRGIGLYYRFIGNTSLASVASDIREKAIAGNRRALLLKDIKGVNQEYVGLLREMSITNTQEMLEAGKTAKLRAALSKRTGIPGAAIMELVRLSDISRIKAVKNVRARLYHDAGIDTVEKLAKWDSEKLRRFLIDYVNRSGFDGIAPLKKEVESTINDARELPIIIQNE